MYSGFGVSASFFWSLGNLDAAGLAATANLYLGLDDNNSTNLGGCCLGFFWGVGD